MLPKGHKRVALATIVALALLTLNYLPGFVAAAPTLTITTPKADEIVAGNTTSKGQSTGASAVELKVDSEDTWRSATGNSTWTYSWNTKGYSTGYHNLYFRATNGSAVSDTKTLRVYVNNTPPEAIRLDVSATPLEISPGENVTVSGFIEYDTGVKLKGTDVNIAVLTTNISITVTTDDNAYFIKMFQGPRSANRYTLRVSTTDGTLSEHKDFELSVTTATQPDLRVKKLEIDPIRPKVKDTVSICATVENIGEESASATVRFTVDGVFLESKNVQVNTEAVAKAVWMAEYGEHTIKAELTNVNPADKDPSNNQMSIKVVPETLPDIYVEEVTVSNPSPHAGQTVTVKVLVENQGYSGGLAKLTLYDGDVATGRVITSKDFSINANGTEQLYLNWVPTQGVHTITAHVTLAGQDAQPQNTMTKEVTVLPPLAKKKKEQTPGPGAISVVSVLAAVALVVSYLRRRGDER